MRRHMLHNRPCRRIDLSLDPCLHNIKRARYDTRQSSCRRACKKLERQSYLSTSLPLPRPYLSLLIESKLQRRKWEVSADRCLVAVKEGHEPFLPH